ncbi:acyl-CoA dehydrogenase family protein [Streptomyces sp. RKAG337]|uniref:acyl-CoA dehydrogenase family protein n=1 Tax=Streptomyces sp. RKAG337 TaxID=2893404 RepID=UPI002033415D|nr:acyl-CoA dehydrogenase family protein [Streptomyces sp. RKAG337]MCM2424940.1 acyl-CoA dehydrogenase [Streptomyces sp. RKAG337]
MPETTYPAAAAPAAGPPSHGAAPSGFTPQAARQEAARGFSRLVESLAAGDLEFPLPGSGRTGERFAALRSVAEQDLCLARLAEGHADALAILAELAGPVVGPGERWGVWAAEPPGGGVTAARVGEGWELNGLKQYCSGAHSCTHALVTATAGDGRRLFAVEVRAPGCSPVEDSWPAIGMAGSDTPDVSFHAVPAVAVGKADEYLTRPGFQHGGIGVAACWYGGARAVAATLRQAAARRGPDPHTDAHLGHIDMQLHAARTVLDSAAAEIDQDPLDLAGGARVRSLRVRALVEAVCTEVLTRVGRATGAGPLCHDVRHARNVSDLTVYIRQHHAERNLAELGALIARPETSS